MSALFAQTVVTTDAEIRAAIQNDGVTIRVDADIDLSNSTLSIPSNHSVTMEDAACEIQAKGEPTGIEAVTGYGLPVTEKVLREGQMLIIRDGKIYNAQGVEVK